MYLYTILKRVEFQNMANIKDIYTAYDTVIIWRPARQKDVTAKTIVAFK